MSAQNNGGPWKLIVQGDSEVSWVCPADSEDICDGFATVWSNGKDKARLIAAAPDLLTALSDLLYYSDDVSSPKLYGNAVDAARAAIKKATGSAS